LPAPLNRASKGATIFCNTVTWRTLRWRCAWPSWEKTSAMPTCAQGQHGDARGPTRRHWRSDSQARGLRPLACGHRCPGHTEVLIYGRHLGLSTRWRLLYLSGLWSRIFVRTAATARLLPRACYRAPVNKLYTGSFSVPIADCAGKPHISQVLIFTDIFLKIPLRPNYCISLYIHLR
jgi:hypothetical protein